MLFDVYCWVIYIWIYMSILCDFGDGLLLGLPWFHGLPHVLTIVL
jgi:hypothetical protein